MGPTSQAAREQRRGLGADDGEIGVLGRLGVLGGGELHHLALGDHRGGAGEHVETGERADFDHHLEGLAEQKSPTSTLASLPHSTRAAALPRRMSLSSTTSS